MAETGEDPVLRFGIGGRTCVVTGAASGIGRGIAGVLARAGAAAVLADIDEAGLAETARGIEAAGGRALARPTDIRDRAAVEALAREAADRFGGIDVWVNAAGVLVHTPIVEAAPEDLDQVLGVNLVGMYWCCAAAARAMAPRRSGSIVNISSTGAQAPVAGLSLYAMSKAAVNMLTRSAALEFGPDGIRVNAIAPGFVDTPMVRYRTLDAEGRIDPAAHAALLADRARGSPLGVTGTPEDIGAAALFLASDASRIVTGQVLRADGGMSMV